MHSTELAAAGIADDFGDGGAKVERYEHGNDSVFTVPSG